MSVATEPKLTGSIGEVVENLATLEKTIDPELRVYIFRPSVIEPPCIWNWIFATPFTIEDQVKWRDTLHISTTLAIRHTDVNIEMQRLLRWADRFREVVDSALYTKRPLGAHRGKRDQMSMSSHDFGGVQYLGMDFLFTFHVDRMIPPS